VGTPRGWYVLNSTVASFPAARRMVSPPGCRFAKEVISRTRFSTMHHADDGVLCLRTCAFDISLLLLVVVVIVVEGTDDSGAFGAFVGLHISR